LIFIYTNTLPDGSDGSILEDLMAADRYGCFDLKILCENMLAPSSSNWLDLLRAADLLNTPSLRINTIAYLRDHFSAMGINQANSQQIQELKEEFPDLFENLLISRAEFFPLPPSQLIVTRVAKSQENSMKAKRERFPFMSLATLAVCLYIYQHVTTIIALGPLVPLINVVGFVLVLVIGF
jgi:hypothetical protein